jgi:hypothetical protein
MYMFLSRLLLGVPEFWRLGAFADYNEIAGTVNLIKKEYNTLHLGQQVFQQTRKPIRLQSDTMTAFFVGAIERQNLSHTILPKCSNL